MAEADEYEVGFARDVLAGRHSPIPALVAIGIGGTLAAWPTFFAVEDNLDLGEKFVTFGLLLLFWAAWVVFADASITTARKNFARHPIAATLALLLFAYLAVPTIVDATFRCIAAGSLMPIYGAIRINFLFAPFVTEVALRIFISVAKGAGKVAGSHKE